MATLFVTGPGYGCGSPTSMGRVFNDYDQYVLCLQSTASEILELSLGSRGFPSEAVAAGAKGPRGCCTDGGNGTVAALPGSGTHPVRSLELYGTASEYFGVVGYWFRALLGTQTVDMCGSGPCWLGFGGCLF